jgi:pimeloyl-ACP methyl ester carboxylesterase
MPWGMTCAPVPAHAKEYLAVVFTRGTILWLCLLPLLLGALLAGCRKEEATVQAPIGGGGSGGGAYTITRTIGTDSVSVEAIIQKPGNDTLDVLVLFHGTVSFDSLVLQAAQNTLQVFDDILDREDMLLVSVAYPEEGLLFGDNIRHAEAALLWVRHHAAQQLGISVNRIFLAGHSQGGYLVTRLNTMHAVDGVIANAPGPLNLVFRCGLEENGQLPPGLVCGLLFQTYGSTQDAPTAYMERSLLHFTSGHLSDVLFIQGLNDSPIQMNSWPVFRQQMEACADCQERTFLELPGLGHQALFNSPAAKQAFNDFIGPH